MPTIDEVRMKVQRILTENGGPVQVDRDGDYMLQQDSAVAFVRVQKGFGDEGVVVTVMCPMLIGVKLTPDVYKWVATEGQDFILGGMNVRSKDGVTGDIYFDYSIIGDDLDESELMAAVYATLYTCDDHDDKLKAMFGGALFSET